MSTRPNGPGAAPTYDRIGTGYARVRQADPRIAAAIEAALGDARTVVNVGAGTGSYEPPDRRVVAIDPSPVMLRQRPRDAAPAVLGSAERLPLVDDAVDAALAVLTVHHWGDAAAGVGELRRVARDRVVILSWDPAFRRRFWLTRDYLPEVAELDAGRFPSNEQLSAWLGGAEIVTVPVPADCEDGFMAAYWRRPEAYLDPDVRAGISTFSLLAPAVADRGLRRLAEDLDTGAWHRTYADLLPSAELDLGYRLIVARP